MQITTDNRLQLPQFQCEYYFNDQSFQQPLKMSIGAVSDADLIALEIARRGSCHHLELRRGGGDCPVIQVCTVQPLQH